MTAHFYLMAESFANNNQYTTIQIEEKIMRLSEDVQLINKHSNTNKLYTNYLEIYPQLFYAEYTVEEFICNVTKLKNEGVDRDVLNAFQKIIQKSQTTTFTSNEVISDLVDMTDEDNCHGIIAFHTIQGLQNNLQVIYGIDGWFQFRRHYLGLYPKNENFFMDECSKYFPNIVFHQNNRATIGAILDDFPKKIVYYLTALNDRFRESEDGIRHRTQVLTHFSGNCSLDAIASLEGKASRKLDFTFEFKDDKDKQQKVCCEPHIKLCKSDLAGDNTYYKYRIYFHEGIEDIDNNKILVGHIGEHL